IAAEDQRRAVEMRLAELVARRDVFDAVAEVPILEPRRLADVEMIDRMQVVVEARRGGLLRHQRAAVLQAAVDEENLEAGFCEIAAEHQPVMPRADDDAVVALFEGGGHYRTPPTARRPWSHHLRCAARQAAAWR